jgi:Arc/MetJ-type ribon-helix-helix transcriptional regulator
VGGDLHRRRAVLIATPAASGEEIQPPASAATARHHLLPADALAARRRRGYLESMKSNTKSSVTLPRDELELVQSLKSRLKLKSNVEVIRRGLRLLQETTERQALKAAYREASRATLRSTREAIEALDHLVDEGLD